MAPSRPDATDKSAGEKAPGEFTRLFGAPVALDDSRPTATFIAADPNAPTAEIPALPLKKTEQERPVAEQPSKASARDSFAKYFGLPTELPAGQAPATSEQSELAVPAAASQSPPKADAAAVQPPPPAQFAQQFASLTEAQPAGSEVPMPAPARVPQAPAGAFTKLFGAPAQPAAEALPIARPATPSQPAGEFTKMFSSAPQPSQVAAPAMEAPASGTFTKLFSGEPLAPAPPQPPMAPAPEAKEAGAFTKLFSAPATDPRAGTATPPAVPSPAAQDPLAAFAKPISAAPVPPRPLEVGGKSPAATQIFHRPGGSVEQETPPAAAGPSAFTRIVSRPAAEPAASAPAAAAPPVAAAPASTPPGVAPFFTPPAMAIPPVAVPPPQVPPMPMPWPMPPMQVAAPPPPQPQVPVPQAQAPQPAAPINWMPLIVGINVFVLLAIIVILIFALRK